MSKDDILNALEHCAWIDMEEKEFTCDGCPLHYTDGKKGCAQLDDEGGEIIPVSLIEHVIELARGGKPVKAGIAGDRGTVGSWWYVCGACGEAIDFHDPFCRHCGVPVDWEEEESV